MCVERIRSGPSSGFALIEVIGAALLLVAVLAAAMHSSMDAASGDEVVRAGLFVRVDNALARISGDFERGDLDPIPAAGDSVAYQMPVDPDGDGSMLDADGQVQWGTEQDGVAVAGAKVTIRFVADRVLSEPALAFDLNRDGDTTDLFDLGHLERVLPDGSIIPLTGTWILQPNLNHGADIDGDGVADPIFSSDATGLKTIAALDVTLAVELTQQKWIVQRTRKTILCQNDVH